MKFWCFANIHYDDGLLPYFLDYYTRQGVDCFGFVTHKFNSPLFTKYPCHIDECAEEYITGPRDAALITRRLLPLLAEDDWFVIADLDEFHWSPSKALRDLISPDYTWIPSVLIDRIAPDGRIHPINSNLSLDEQFPLKALVTTEICRAVQHKCTVTKAGVDPSSGHHCAHPAKTSPFSIWTHHFKWAGANFWEHFVQRQVKSRKLDYIVGLELGTFAFHYVSRGKIGIETQIAEQIGI